ncbi:hypothetical protein O6H91_11G111900 [Diphasiastrum complanatum]|nr:hypothetical protein O6H91_11G111900 [Diphasiastrum complanatum]
MISLDTQNIFIDPVDDSFAPNYSKVIKTPMCFKTMKEKVQSQKYLSWQAFVDDFERICYNAMKYNQIRSKIWRAAKKLLRLGKRLIDKFEKGGSELDSIKEVADACRLEHILDDPAIEDLENKSKATDGLKNSCLMASPYSKAVTFLNQMKGIEFFEQKGIDGTVRGAGDAEPKCATPARLSSNLVEDISFDQRNHLKKKGTVRSNFQLQLNVDASEVEIEECTLHEAVRVDSDSQATEYSSSFGSSLGEGESESVCTGYWDSTEVQSRLRNGSGGLLSPQDDALVGEPNERKKKALNQEWKTYRRGIEWRCRWLELRIKALQDQASRYDRFLEESEVKKPWKSTLDFHSTSASRTVPFTDKHIKQPVMYRKRRRKVEDTIDTAAFMSRHPLFSRYEKKKQEQDDPHEGAFDNRHFHLIEHASMGLEETVQPDESDMDEPPSLMKGTTLGEDSIEELLWNIESLQARVVRLRNQLNKGTHVSAWQGLQASNLSPVVLQAQGVQSPVPSPKGILRPPRHRPDAGPSLVGPSKSASSNVLAQKASGSAVVRRRTADYDISNVVMPVSVGAKYVEPVRHARIETPRWRRSGADESSTPARSMGGSSSDEDTDDELYMEMHNLMEAKERLHRMPHSLKRHTDAAAGMSTIYSVAKARGKVTSMDSIELDRKGEDHDNLAAEIDLAYSSASLPKGKRTRRDSKCNFTHSRGRKLLNLFTEPSNIKGSFYDNLDIKSEFVPDTEAHEGGIGPAGMQTMDPRHFCL